MLNKIILIGRLTRDPELKYTPNGVAVCSFTLAVDRKYNKNDTDFIDIVVWRGLAENCANYLHKGRLTAVDGRLQIRTYETQEGQKRKVAEVIADDVRFLEKPGTGSSTAKASSDIEYVVKEDSQEDWTQVGRELNNNDIDVMEADEDDEIPF
ncbi:MAG: single-stranded DNA-binding protein [Syntrophomonadaceae bacterium]|nr:single-stranded DNA-binding protein [Syntrophomonadaceae bacterium]